MAIVYLSHSEVPPVPQQVCFVAGNADLGIFAKRITTSKTGTSAIISAPRETFVSSTDHYLRSEIVIYARNAGEDYGNPLFRGYIDARSRNLRDGRVEFMAFSDYHHFRNRSTSIKESLISDDGYFQTFVDAGYNQFLEHNPFVPSAQTFINWTPSQILNYFITYNLEAEFASKITFKFDETNVVQAPYTVPSYRWELNGSNEPTLVLSVEFKSSLGNQTIMLGSWGALIDYIASMMPGVQVYEIFTSSGTELWFAPPFRNGHIVGTAGLGGFNWSDVGANISELQQDNDNRETANRFIGTGAPGVFTVTIASNSVDAEEGLTGLVPAWELFDTEAAVELVPLGVEGLANYVYSDSAYDITTTTKQKVVQVYQNSNIRDPEEAAYRDGYEFVGCKWRLPNWFAFCNIERGADMFSDPQNGSRVNVQVFVEKAVLGSNGNYAYEWMAYNGNVVFDWEKKTFTLDELPWTYVIHENTTTGKFEPWVEGNTILNGSKLARVAITFTYNTRHYIPYADTYLEAGGFIDPLRLTSVASGNPAVFERMDIKYHQISNIGKPLWIDFRERYLLTPEEIETHGSWSYQESGERIGVTYNWFIVEAYKSGYSKLQANVTPESFVRGGYGSPLIDPVVLRDDTQRLHRIVWDMYSWRGKIARTFSLQFGWLVKAARRGMMLYMNNLNIDGNDWDAISSVVHDLEFGKTTIVTTNQPGNELDVLVLARDE